MSRAIAARFAAAARTYDRRAGIQRQAAARLIARLRRAALVAAPPEWVLEIGCGTGILTRKVRRAYPAARVCAIDVAPAMARMTRRALRGDRRLFVVAADGAQFALRRRVPLIVSSSTLHWLAPLDRTLRHLASLLEPGGCWPSR